MKANNYSEITTDQWDAIKEAAIRCNATPNDMAGFFLAGDEWDAEDALALANLLEECWLEAKAPEDRAEELAAWRREQDAQARDINQRNRNL